MKRTINSEKKSFRQKRLFELAGTLILLIVAIILLCKGVVLNPFRIADANTSKDVQKAYEKKISYVKLTGQTLDFTGYYKMDSKGDIAYNCYITTGKGIRFFVFLPVERTVDENGKTIETITDYSLIGRIKRDKQLIETIAADYEVTSENFIEECSISELIIDENGAHRKEATIIWVALFGLLSTYIIYVLIVLFVNRGMGGKQNGEIQA